MNSPACWSWPVIRPTLDDYHQRFFAESTAKGCDQEKIYKLWAWELKYPFTDSDWLSYWQAHRCAICGDARRELELDHDHATGLVRGWLCHSCNTAEGVNQRQGIVYAKYRVSNPASILGLKIRYLDPFTGDYAAPRTQIVDQWNDQDNGLSGIGL